jgi:hypothetical protein
MSGKEQQEFFDTFTTKMKATILSKGDDYAGQEDRLNNFKVAGNAAGGSAEINCLNLIATKVARLGQLLNSKQIPKHEAVDDSILDLANYAFLLACIKHEQKMMRMPEPSPRRYDWPYKRLNEI